MRQNHFFNILFIGCILTLFTGCGAAPQTPSASYITIAEAKAVVLENVGLLEQDVKFVRFYLDSAGDVSRYDIELISEKAEYDYVVNAVTGEILSMSYEAGDYNIDNVPPEIMQAANTQSVDTQPVNTPPVNAQPVNTPPVNAQPVSTPPVNVPSANTPSANAQPDAGQQYIGIEAAKQAALYHADLNAADVRFAHAHLDLEHGCWTYDVEFHKDNTEYDYSIDALTGEILSYDHDTEYHHHGANISSPGSELIPTDRAKQIALAYAGVSEADAQYLEIEFDYDNGRAEYEVEWHVGKIEYACDIDAYTGEILSFEKEYD